MLQCTTRSLSFFLLLILLLKGADSARAADKPAAPVPDTVVFTNGDSLKGKLVSANGAGIVFHSDMAGDLTIAWDKIKTLDAKEKFAAIQTGQTVTKKTPASAVPEGTVAFADKNVSVSASAGTPGGTTTVPASKIAALVDAAGFEKTVYQGPGILHGYTGAFTLGVAVVESTQTSNTFNGALTLARTVPDAAWISPRNKTTLDASAIYGIQKQPAEPAFGIVASSVKTDIIHGDLERDEYIKPRFYYLGYASADHNYSSGLALQDTFGGGFGYTALKSAKQELDIKTDLHYEQQQFVPSTVPNGSPNNNLVGMDFSESYTRKLPKGLGLSEVGVVTPSFNNATASATQQDPGRPFSAAFTNNFTFPVYKRLSFNAGIVDDYLSDPAPGFNSNSFQLTFGATYAFK